MEIKLIVCRHGSHRLAMSDGEKNDSVLFPVRADALPTDDRANNRRYNELSAAYWARNNLAADWYGLMHYRRFFLFLPADKPLIVDKKGNLPCDFSHEKLEKICSSCDFVAPLPLKKGNLYRHYAHAHNESDLILATDILCRKYPEYAEICRAYLNSDRGYFYNMFLFPKDIFYRYCDWIFDILGEYEQKTSGRMYVSERLTGIFIAKLLAEGKRAAFFPTVYRPERNFSVALKQSLRAFRTDKRLRAFKPLLCKILPSSWSEKLISE